MLGLFNLLLPSGEHIKTWRPRYFILRNDGYFNGYNNKPLTSNSDDILVPNNSFFIKGLILLKLINKGKFNNKFL